MASHPFFGRLLLRLQFGFSDCGTAFTNMRLVVFDPVYGESLSETELRFVLLHELLHCVLKHCIRGRTFEQELFNIACDIVVNSMAMELMKLKPDFTVAGNPVLHCAPNDREGRDYTAEEVYRMLSRDRTSTSGAWDRSDQNSEKNGEQYGDDSRTSSTPLDNHDPWQSIADDKELDAQWDSQVLEAGKAVGGRWAGNGLPVDIMRQIGQLYQPLMDWRAVLAEFIRHDRDDFSFMRPDTRFGYTDLILPSFLEDAEGEALKNIWVCIDTSRSINRKQLVRAYSEIVSLIEQMENIEGKLSFFSVIVTPPAEFTTVDEFLSIVPDMTGGTSFEEIFSSMPSYFSEDDLPTALIIITDGYAPFPPESSALEVPVIWLIIDTLSLPHGVRLPLSGAKKQK